MEAKKSDKANLEDKRGLFLQIGLVVALGAILYAFEWTSRPNIDLEMFATSDAAIEEEIVPITRQQVQVTPPPPPQVINTINIVEDNTTLEDEFIALDADADLNTEVNIQEFKEDEEEAVEEVFYIVEDMPSFQGGDLNTFRNWVQSNMEYPAIASENGISGKVIVQFAINARGEVVDVQVVRGVDPSLDKEAMRAVKLSPKWAPGKQRGKPVKVQYTMPVNFVLH